MATAKLGMRAGRALGLPFALAFLLLLLLSHPIHETTHGQREIEAAGRGAGRKTEQTVKQGPPLHLPRPFRTGGGS